jgi:hypothetical protein
MYPQYNNNKNEKKKRGTTRYIYIYIFGTEVWTQVFFPLTGLSHASTLYCSYFRDRILLLAQATLNGDPPILSRSLC